MLENLTDCMVEERLWFTHKEVDGLKKCKFTCVKFLLIAQVKNVFEYKVSSSESSNPLLFGLRK